MKKSVSMFLVLITLLLTFSSCNDPSYMTPAPLETDASSVTPTKTPADDLSFEEKPTAPSDSSFKEEPTESFDSFEIPAEPAEMFSTRWLEWLCFETMGNSTKYPIVNGGALYEGFDYDGADGPMIHSAWEIWPYVDSTIDPQSHFHLNLMLNIAEVDAFTGLGTDDYCYTWKVFYKIADTEEDYKMVECTPWGTCPVYEYMLYRLNLMDYGCEMSLNEDGSTRSYHMVFLILNKDTGEVLAWNDQYVDWTNSSEAAYQDALKHGVIKTED